MARPKTIQQAAENLRTVAPLVQARYVQGVTGADWQTPAASDQAETNYADGVQRAVARGARRDGIMQVTNQAWQQAAINKGGPRIGPGITESIDKYPRNFGPILQAITAAVATLPPRTTSAQQNVQNRLMPIIRAEKEAAGREFN